MAKMVQISKEMLKDIYIALADYRAYLGSDARNAKRLDDCERENYYRSAAQRTESLADDIRALIDQKE